MSFTLSKRMRSADRRQAKIVQLFLKIKIFIAIFGFIMQNAFKWVQTSLVFIQWFLNSPIEFEKELSNFNLSKMLV